MFAPKVFLEGLATVKLDYLLQLFAPTPLVTLTGLASSADLTLAVPCCL